MIIIILFIAGYAFLRGKRKAWSTGVFPLMLIPAVNIILQPRHMEMLPNGHFIRAVIYFASLAVMSVWSVLWARRLPHGKSKFGYIFCSVLFSFVLVMLLFFKGTIYR